MLKKAWILWLAPETFTSSFKSLGKVDLKFTATIGMYSISYPKTANSCRKRACPSQAD